MKNKYLTIYKINNMGLELVELIMEIEDQFEIEIPD
jgi:hypothetical protein